MQPQWQTTTYEAGYGLAADRHKVLRNTYMLLALSMIPTALGALAGISMHFMLRGWAGPLIFFAVSIGAFYAIQRTRNSPAGVVLLLAYTGFMGLWLSQILQVALRFGNGGQLIALAAGGTAAIFFTLATIATVTKRDFSFMSQFLFVGLVVLCLASLVNLFFAVPAVSLAISAAAVLLFSGYILFDVSNIINGGETNYITATLQLYLDILNIFISLLNILMAFSGDRR
ncbi:MAG: Bax inhibitor-1/YccA family protein [Burkholderiales bacterium]|nr:Bax inhibitor-1/YccA family protein [Burkholderiales bacterium]